MSAAPLELTREHVLAHRRRVGALDRRLPMSPESLRRAAWAGLPDSMPRAALVGLHARVADVTASTLDDPTLSQVWGPRFSDHVVAEQDAAIFTLGRLPTQAAPQRRAAEMADRLDAFLHGRRMPFGAAGRGVGVVPNALRYGTATGRLRIAWDGAHQPEVWTVPGPSMSAAEARAELARRYLHVLGPGTAAGFGRWAGLRLPGPALDLVRSELAAVRTVAGDGWILAADEASFRRPPAESAGLRTVRLLPSGDTYVLCWGADRELVVPDAGQRAEVWTTRVWPGTVLVRGEIVATWRRAEHQLSVHAFGTLAPTDREAIEAEAESLPLPGLHRSVTVRWDD
jgi:Winged helix DNA-binding domain